MHHRRFLALVGASLIAAVLPSVPAFAQRQADEGDLQILHARYGTAARNVDVTGRLQELAKRDVSIEITNDTFGVDPAFGEEKTLRIYARALDGATRMFEFRERDIVNGAHFTGWSRGAWGENDWRGGWDGQVAGPRGARLSIETALYGVGRQSRDVTGRVRSLVRQGRLDFDVQNETFGIDPAPGREKTLIVVFSIDGQRREVRVPERGRLTLP